MRTSVLHTVLVATVLAAALVACSEDTVFTHWGSNPTVKGVVPDTIVDTTSHATVDLNEVSGVLQFTLTATKVSSAITEAAIWTGSSGVNTNPTPVKRLVLCTATCPAASGASVGPVAASGTFTAPYTIDSLAAAMRAYGTFVRIVTTNHAGAGPAGGELRGLVFPIGNP